MGDLRFVEGLRVGLVDSGTGAEVIDRLRRRGAAISPDPAGRDDTRRCDEATLLEATDAVLEVGPAWVVAGSGPDVRAWDRLARRHGRGERLRAVLDRAGIAVRGVGAVADLQSLGVAPAFLAPGETTAEAVAWVIQRAAPGDTVAVVAGRGGQAAVPERLEQAGLRVLTVTPRHVAPRRGPPALPHVVDAGVAGRLDALVVTSPAAGRRLVRTADRRGRTGGLRAALRGPVGAAVMGPPTADAVETAGIPVAVMPPRARPGALVDALASWATDRANGGLPAHRDRRWPIVLEPAARTARVAGRPVTLGAVGFGVLAALVRRPRVTCPHGLLLREAWGGDAPDDPVAIKHHICRIRERLGPAGGTIATVRGVGYRYAPRRRPAGGAPVSPGSTPR